ncbi:MAG: HD domain-containing protein [Anaerolineales bacterium]|nr:HD domain-containing protein [Anaerolineales bacterium]
MGLRYRAGQFWRLLFAAPLATAAWQDVAAVLSPAELRLFARFSAGDQQHSYDVLCTLRAAGYENAELLAAALLHDVGKTRVRLSVWERSLIVLAQRLFPGRLAAWGGGAARGWRRPFVVKQQHPAWGAEMAAAAGAAPLVVSLIRRHQDAVLETAVTPEDALLRQLQWADDRN